MDSYIPFETALMFLVTAYLVSVTLLLVVADVAITVIAAAGSDRAITNRGFLGVMAASSTSAQLRHSQAK